jgi:Flp pilus assembly pilin Flp
MTEDALLLALIALGLVDLAAIVLGWIADRHITRTARHRKED